MVARDLSGKAAITDNAKLRRAPRQPPPHQKSLVSSPPIVTSAKADLTKVAGSTLPDVLPVGVTWTPANPVPGDHIVFTVTILNQGAAATPPGVIVDCLFTLTDNTNTTVGGRSWSDNNSTSLAAGASRQQTANGGDNGGYILAPPVGTYTLTMYVNGNVRFPESDRTNNTATQQFQIASGPATVPGAPTGLTATPGNSIVSLSWNVPTNTGGATITGFRIYRNGTLLTSPAATAIQYDDTTAVNGTTYTYTISAVNSVGEGAQSAGVQATPFASTGAPALPANAVVGNPANQTIWWGGWNLVNSFPGDFDRWVGAGFVHMNAAGSEPGKYAVPADSGSGQQFYDVAQGPLAQTSQNGWQRAWEGYSASGITGTGAGHFYYKRTKRPQMIATIGEYVARAPGYDGVTPPFGNKAVAPNTGDLAQGNWWNDTYFANLAAYYGKIGRALKNVFPGDGIHFDPEPGNYTAYTSTAHPTAAEQYQKIHDRGYQCGTAYWQNFPDGKLLIYQWGIAGSWQNWLAGWWQNGDTRPWGTWSDSAWMLGWFKACCDFGSPLSRVIFQDRNFYQPGEGGMGGDRGAKNKLNNEGSCACLSQPYPNGVGSASWSRGCDRFFISPASAADGGWGSEKPNATPVAQWQAQITVDREWAMAPYRSVYAGPGQGNANSGVGSNRGPDGGFYQFGTSGGAIWSHMTTHLAANQAGSDPTIIPTVLPTCTNLVWTGSTLSCRAAHKYGVRYVKVYNGNGFNPANPDPSYLGAMTMTWTHPSLPDYTSGIPADPSKGGNGTAGAQSPTFASVADSYQACTFTRAGASGDWLVLKVVTVKDDVAWFRVAHP